MVKEVSGRGPGRPPKVQEDIIPIEKFTTGLRRGGALNTVPFDNFYDYNNVVPFSGGGYRKRDGITSITATNVAWNAGGKPVELYEWVTDAGVWLWIFRVNTKLYSWNGTALSTIHTWGTAPNNVNFEKFFGKMYIFPDNSTPLQWDGTAESVGALTNVPAGNWPFAAVFRNRLFIGRKTTNKLQTRYSDADLASSWPAASEINIPRPGNMTGLTMAHDRLYTFSELEVHALIGDSSNWLIRRVGEGGQYFLGRTACQSPMETPYGILVARPKRFCVFDGQQYQTVGKSGSVWPPAYYYEIEATANSNMVFNYTYFDNKVYVAYYNSSYPTYSRVLVYDYDTGVWSTMDLSGVTNGLIASLAGSVKDGLLYCMAGTTDTIALSYFNTDASAHTYKDTIHDSVAYQVKDSIKTGFLNVGARVNVRKVTLDYTAYMNQAFDFYLDVYLDNDYDTVVKTVTLSVPATSTKTRNQATLRIEREGDSVALGLRSNSANAVIINNALMYIDRKESRYTT